MTEEQARELIATTPQWIAAPCPWCGATTLDEAAEKCRPSIGFDGEYYCGTPEEAPETDGKLHQLNPKWAELEGYLWHWFAFHDGLANETPVWRGEAT